MSEILSQEEVDSLLDGLDSGEIETEKDVENHWDAGNRGIGIVEEFRHMEQKLLKLQHLY